MNNQLYDCLSGLVDITKYLTTKYETLTEQNLTIKSNTFYSNYDISGLTLIIPSGVQNSVLLFKTNQNFDSNNWSIAVPQNITFYINDIPNFISGSQYVIAVNNNCMIWKELLPYSN